MGLLILYCVLSNNIHKEQEEHTSPVKVFSPFCATVPAKAKLAKRVSDWGGKASNPKVMLGHRDTGK